VVEGFRMNVDTLVSDSTPEGEVVHSIGDLAGRRSRSNGHSRKRYNSTIRGKNVPYTRRSTGRIYSLDINEVLTGHPIHTNQTLSSYGIPDSDERAQLLSTLGRGQKKEGAEVVRQSELIARETRLADYFATGSEHARAAFMAITRYVAEFGVNTTRRFVDLVGIESMATIGYNPLFMAAAYK
jgi:hypothetical protein|tara:strand:- start:5576 stop:6124 length:549 start_codon:yes stop_codon:yes gene_type:complete